MGDVVFPVKPDASLHDKSSNRIYKIINFNHHILFLTFFLHYFSAHFTFSQRTTELLAHVYTYFSATACSIGYEIV